MAHRHLVIVLGSSRFPNCSLEPAISLRTSARRFIEYCGEALDLQIDDDILDLFGSKETSGRQLQIISDFLKENIGPETGNPNVLVTLYYLGHGYFAKTDRSYCLAVCGTTDNFTPSDGLQAKDLLFRLKNFAPNRKRFIVLDACFSASAMGDYTTLSATDNAIKDELERNLDDWTAMYCAARSDEYALAPAKSRFTLFSHGVLEALEKGGPHPADVTNTPPLLLSLTKLDEIAWSIIRTEFQELGDIPRPLLFFPEKPKFNNEEEIFPIASQLRGQRLSAETRGVLQQEMQLIKASIQEEIINLIGKKLRA